MNNQQWQMDNDTVGMTLEQKAVYQIGYTTGYNDGYEGNPQTVNPYPSGEWQHEIWDNGYWQGMDDS